jgi:hypothetical protein
LLSATYGETNTASQKSDQKTERVLNRAEAKKLISRLHEIKDLARTQELSITEKKQLRSEVQYIKETLEKMSGVYLYLSVTTIIIILLLIILL